ncbi:MAG: hypothetical protein ACI8UX_002194 [Psychromonas sp.]|jgi:hypothetical protein
MFLSDDKIEDFAFIIDNYVKFETLEALDTPSPIVELPILALFLNLLLLCIRLLLQVRIDVKSTKKYRYIHPIQQIFKTEL